MALVLAPGWYAEFCVHITVHDLMVTSLNPGPAF